MWYYTAYAPQLRYSMRSPTNTKLFLYTTLIFLLLALPSAALAGVYDNLPADYVSAITNARTHIDGPSGWLPTDNSIITITGVPGTEIAGYGLTYDTTSYGDNYLITRTLTQSSYYLNTKTQGITGVGAYTTYDDGKSHQASWVTTGNDTTNLLDNNGVSASNVVKLLERGLGMNNTGTHTAIVEYAVLPTNTYLMRPSLWPNIRTFNSNSTQYGYQNPLVPDKPAGMSQAAYDYLSTYLNYWQAGALGNWHASPVVDPTSPFPWTQLGYTYFWGNGDALNKIKGMSEFIILGGTSLYIYGIYSPQSYIYTKNNGEYGNGYANFNVTGSCDTIWAGSKFQKKVSASIVPGSENTITIQPAGSLSGGQGILVWSLNYVVDNQGTISGSTAKKFGLNNTENIAVLFKGNTDVAGAVNQLTNSGTISSPGTAIKVEEGDTTITNSGSGAIYGDNYAIQTSATSSGTDTVTIKGGTITGSIDLGGGNDTFNVTGADSNVTLNFFLDRDTRTSAQVVNAENVAITDNKATLAVSAKEGAENIHNNDSFLIVDAGTLLTADAAKISVQNDATLPMVTFAVSKSGNKLYLDATRDDTYYASNSSNGSLGGVLDSLAESGSVDMSVVIGALDDTDNVANALKLEPVAAAPVVNTAIATLNNFGSVFSAQMARLSNDAGQEIKVYAVGDGKRKRVPASAVKNMLAYNSNSILENSFNRTEKWETFATGFGIMSFQSDRNDSVGYVSGGGGTQFGFYRRANDSAMLGVLGGYMFDNIRLNNKAGSQDINSLRVGPCAKLLKENLYAVGALTYGYHAVGADRKIDIGLIQRQADADYKMHDISPYMETGYIIHLGRSFEITPNISLQYDWMHSQSYDESGAGAANLSVASYDANSLVSALGLRVSGRVDKGNIIFLPEFNAGWQHEYLGRLGDITASFASESAGTFTTNTNVFDRNAVRLGMAANFIYGKKHNALSFQYNAEVYDSASNHVFSITCRNYF